MKTDKKTVQAWIDNSNLVETIVETSQKIPDTTPLLPDEVSRTVDNSDLADELLDKINDALDEAYDEGFENGEKDADNSDYEATEIDEVSDLLQEEIGVNFVVEKFKDCKTLEEFQYEYQFIYSRSLNFMR